MELHAHDFTIPTLGPGTFPSPVKLAKRMGGEMISEYVEDDELIIYDVDAEPGDAITYERRHLIERAGPREMLFFDSQSVHAAIVTCGGLCPGLNDVIRSLVYALWYQYGARRIKGVRYGYRGFLSEFGHNYIPLKPDLISNIHSFGGSILGSSRGHGRRTMEFVDEIEKEGINQLFTIGGDGTQRGTLDIAKEVERRGLNVSVVGIPKTIDNDLSFIEKSFGFETAVSVAVQAVSDAHIEATSAVNGIGLVKLMGRDAGFIAAYTAMGSREANFVLVPEVRFDMDGDNGFLAHLERRLQKRGHALVIVAEGAGQEHLAAASTETDASGNKKLGDIGIYMKDRINDYFKVKDVEINLKYIDPSYTIRATAANPIDSIYCARLGTHAVHAAMAGKTKMLISYLNGSFVHIPTGLAVAKRNCINPKSALWRDVIEATGQPNLMLN